MPASDAGFTGSIPDLYERYLVPLIFTPYARDIAERTSRARPREVLETAAGTGVVTRALAARLSGARIVATDINDAMIAQARTQTPASVVWTKADATALPCADASFDAVVCQLGAMFFPDKIQGYSEARRVLKRGGSFHFNVWDRLSENDFADVVTAALANLYPDDPPRFLARTPHGYHDVERIRRELAIAGFDDVTVDAVDATSTAPSAQDVAVAYCQGTPLRTEIEARAPTGLEHATQCATEALTQRFGSGVIAGRIRAFVFTAAR